MKTLYILIIGLLVSGGVLAQSCLPEGITFETQAQVDSFQILYPNCTEIEGDLIISGDNITHLNGLNVLTTILGTLSIGDVNGGNPALTNLTGLDNVTFIGGNILILFNDALTNLTGLNNLNSIGGFLGIAFNNALTSLSGLEGLTNVGLYLGITYSNALTNLAGLESLNSIGGDLEIYDNSMLTSLSGLNNLTSIGDNLLIEENDVLTSLSGLDNVISIGGYLLIDGNNTLTSLTGLDNVTSIGGYLLIDGNNTLTSLTGLDNIDASSISDLYIYDNVLLSTCEVLSVCEYLASPNGTIDIYDNATGCDNTQEVQDSCEANGVNINEQLIFDKVLIYPNPSSTQITIELPHTPQKNTSLTIYNLNGQQLITQKITEPQTVVDISGLPQGVYFVKVVDDRMVMIGKVVVE